MKTQKGITLIALIITIIVMLILVGVSVTVALNTGLFKTAQGAAKNTQIAREKETALSNGEINVGGTDISIDEYIDRLSTGMPVELKIGDIIEYTPASSYTSSAKYSVPTEYAGCSGSFYTDMGDSVEWKIIGVEGNTIKIIPNSVSTAKLTITGANGWNNSIEALNNVCGVIYGNTTNDKYTATAKSLTVEDINKIAGYTVVPSTISYNASDYGSNNYFPTEYLEENGVTVEEIDKTNGYAVNSNITVESTEYGYIAESQTGLNSKFANWVNLSTYWLASRCVYANSDNAFFVLRYVLYPGNVYYTNVFSSGGNEVGISNAVRPVVSLTPKFAPTLDPADPDKNDDINYWIFE